MKRKIDTKGNAERNEAGASFVTGSSSSALNVERGYMPWRT